LQNFLVFLFLVFFVLFFHCYAFVRGTRG